MDQGSRYILQRARKLAGAGAECRAGAETDRRVRNLELRVLSRRRHDYISPPLERLSCLAGPPLCARFRGGMRMPHIALPEGLPGITSGFAFRPETARPMRELAEVLLRGPNTLTSGEREMIATFVSSQERLRLLPGQPPRGRRPPSRRQLRPRRCRASATIRRRPSRRS